MLPSVRVIVFGLLVFVVACRLARSHRPPIIDTGDRSAFFRSGYLGPNYVAVAKQLTEPRARDGVGLGGTETVAFTPRSCTDAPSLWPTLVQDLGIGEPPKN